MDDRTADHQPRFKYQNLSELEAELTKLNLSLPMHGSRTGKPPVDGSKVAEHV